MPLDRLVGSPVVRFLVSAIAVIAASAPYFIQGAVRTVRGHPGCGRIF